MPLTLSRAMFELLHCMAVYNACMTLKRHAAMQQTIIPARPVSVEEQVPTAPLTTLSDGSITFEAAFMGSMTLPHMETPSSLWDAVFIVLRFHRFLFFTVVALCKI